MNELLPLFEQGYFSVTGEQKKQILTFAESFRYNKAEDYFSIELATALEVAYLLAKYAAEGNIYGIFTEFCCKFSEASRFTAFYSEHEILDFLFHEDTGFFRRLEQEEVDYREDGRCLLEYAAYLNELLCTHEAGFHFDDFILTVEIISRLSQSEDPQWSETMLNIFFDTAVNGFIQFTDGDYQEDLLRLFMAAGDENTLFWRLRDGDYHIDKGVNEVLRDFAWEFNQSLHTEHLTAEQYSAALEVIHSLACYDEEPWTMELAKELWVMMSEGYEIPGAVENSDFGKMMQSILERLNRQQFDITPKEQAACMEYCKQFEEKLKTGQHSNGECMHLLKTVHDYIPYRYEDAGTVPTHTLFWDILQYTWIDWWDMSRS